MEPLTERQARILGFIRRRIAVDGRPPTVREIGARFRIRSTNGVRRHLTALEKKGYIERHARMSRGISLAAELQENAGLPIVGRVAAGTPITAVENLDGFLSIDTLFPSPGSLFCLRVEGDSMIDAGIWDGDYVIVRKQETAEDGDIVVALINDEATLKRYYRQADGVRLEPANGKMSPICVDSGDFRIQGKVVAVYRIM